MTSNPIEQERHFKYLDSTRGIAAMMVFLCHFISRNYPDKINVHYFFFLINGNEAVSYFFVLSGFVLSYKYIALNKALDIRQFYVARFFRIFPAYFLIVLFSVFVNDRNHLNAEFLKSVFIFNTTGFWHEASLLRFHNGYYYPGWTLTVEMLASLLMPFYIALAIKNRRFIPYYLVVFLIIGHQILFSVSFLLGILAVCYLPEITAPSFKETKWYRYRYIILPVAYLFFSLRQLDIVSPLGPDYKSFFDQYLGINFFILSGFASLVFLVAILYSKKAQRILEHKALVFLGKISFSIYLVHIVVIEIVYAFVEPYLIRYHYDVPAFLVVSLAVVPSVILVATGLHYIVELPFIKIGKRIIAKMKPSLVIKRDQ